MHISEMTHSTPPDNRIVARPPFGRPPFDPKERLPVSRRRVCVGLLLLVSSFAVGVGSAFFPAAKLWLFAACVLLLMCSSWFSDCIVYVPPAEIRENCMDTSASNQSMKPLSSLKPRHRIIVVLPRLEEWIIKTARLAKIRMGEFGLSDRANELHREITSKLLAFEKLLSHLIAMREARVAYLRILIRH
jgi:hypothetical protein